MASLNFDARNYDPAQGGGNSLPVSDENGWPVIITASGPKACKDSTPQNQKGYLEVTFTGIQEPVKGLSGVNRYNVWNPSEQTVEIAFRELSALCHVCGVFALSNDGRPGIPELHGIPLRVLVRQQVNNPKYTEIYGVKDINGNDPGKAGAQQPASAPTIPQAPPTASAHQQPATQPFSAPASSVSMPPAETAAAHAAWTPGAAPANKPPWG